MKRGFTGFYVDLPKETVREIGRLAKETKLQKWQIVKNAVANVRLMKLGVNPVPVEDFGPANVIPLYMGVKPSWDPSALQPFAAKKRRKK